jgi:hypothetical protein
MQSFTIHNNNKYKTRASTTYVLFTGAESETGMSVGGFFFLSAKGDAVGLPIIPSQKSFAIRT